MSSPREPRIRQLAQEARQIRASAESTAEDDVDLTPLVAARDGLGPVLAVYVEARAGEDSVRFSQTELDLLHRATNDWLVVYAREKGVGVDPDATVREAAELLIDTHDVVDVASQLTGLPAE